MLNEMLPELIRASFETVLMVFVSGTVAVLFGMPLGVILSTTKHGQILQNKKLNMLLASLINAFRSTPFIILLIAIIPLTRLIAGTSIGTAAAIVPLTVAAIPFVARVVENALNEVSFGLVEMGLAIGATPLQIIAKILIPEALPGIINGITITLVNLVGYSAMAGTIGGGGLGDLAIRYGYQRFDTKVMVATVIVLIALVQLLQWVGDGMAKSARH